MEYQLKEVKRFKLKVGVLLVLIENNKILLSRRYNTGIGDGRHLLPMGGLEDGETVTQAIIREAQEETNILLHPSMLKVVHVMHRLHYLPNGDSFPQMDVFFVSGSYEGTIQNMEPDKCDELKFYPLDALPSTIEPFIERALHCIRINQIYSEIGWRKKEPFKEVDLGSEEKTLSPQIDETTAKTYD